MHRSPGWRESVTLASGQRAASVAGDVASKSVGERREMRLDDITDDFDVDSGVLVDEDVAEATDLRPRDLEMRAGDRLREMIHCLADDLQVALDGILGHVGGTATTVQHCEVPRAPFDGFESVNDALPASRLTVRPHR